MGRRDRRAEQEQLVRRISDHNKNSPCGDPTCYCATQEGINQVNKALERLGRDIDKEEGS